MDRLCYLFFRGGLRFGPLIQVYIRHFLPPRDFADIWRSLEPNNGLQELKRRGGGFHFYFFEDPNLLR